MTLANVKNATEGSLVGTGTIQDDEGSPTVNFSTAAKSVDEREIWWDSSYAKRLKLTFNNASQTENLNNFPVLVKLNSSRVNYADIKDAGEDIRFVDSNGITNLDYEIETWNESGDSIIWVKVPRIDANSSSDHIWMYYGNTSASDAQNPGGVWNGIYSAVWHFNSTIDDSSNNNINLIENNTTDQAGVFAGAKGFSAGSSSYMYSQTASDFDFGANDSYFFSGWVKSTAAQSANAIMLHRRSAFEWAISGTSIKEITSTNWVSRVDSRTGIFPVGTWQHLVMSFDNDADTAKMYIDGKLIYERAVTASNMSSATGDFVIGSYNLKNSYFTNMDLDELRFSKTKPNKNWIQAQYLSQTDNFITYTNQGITLELDVASDTDVTIPFTVSGTATNPSDHTLSSGSITIPAYQKAAVVALNIVDDATSESDETVILTMGSVTGAAKGTTDVHTTTIIDDDGKSSLSINDITVAEAGTASFTVTLSPAAGTTVTVDYTTTDGSAKNTTDYTAATGSLTFLAGETSKTIDVITTNDSLDEYTENFNVVLSNPSSNARIVDALGKASITDDDPLVDVEFTVTSNTVGENAGSISVSAQLSTASGKYVRIPFTISGTSVNPDDHSAQDSQISFSPGQTSRNYTFNIEDDVLDEDNESIIFTASAPTAANLGANTVHTVTITDNDNPPTLSIQSSAASENGDFTLVAELSAVSGRAVGFDWATSDGTALSGQDYAAAAGNSLSIPAGSTSLSLGTIKINDDSFYEGDETFNIAFSSITNSSAPASIPVTITDNESAPVINLAKVSGDIIEGDRFVLIIDLDTASVSDVQVDVSFSGAAVPTADYSANDFTATIPAGSTSFQAPIDMVLDGATETDESLVIDISNPVNASIGSNSQGNFVLKDGGSLTSAPVYSGNNNWNDYVLNDEPAKAKWKQTNDTCVIGAFSKNEQCIHGAEFFMVDLGVSVVNCGALGMRDTLDLFHWTCDDSSGNAIFYSTSLKTTRPLSKMIDPSTQSLYQNNVILSDAGVDIGSSSRTAWWTNSVTSLPNNAGSSPMDLNSSGTIYYLAATQSTPGYRITADKISIAGEPGAVLSQESYGSNTCNDTTGLSASANKVCTISVGSQNYLWFESLDIQTGGNSDIGLMLANTNHINVKSLILSETLDTGISILNSGNSILDDVSVYSSNIGLNSSNLHYSKILNSQAMNTGTGFMINQCNNLFVSKAKASNNLSHGFHIASPSSGPCYFNTILATNNGDSGFYSDVTTSLVIQGASLTNNTNSGLLATNSNQLIANNILSANNGDAGISLKGSGSNSLLSQVAVMDNGNYGISSSHSNSKLSFNFIAGGNTTSDCFVDGAPSAPGFIDATCANADSSNANYVNNIDASDSFIGKIQFDDRANPDDLSGSATYASTLIPYFENVYRAWGLTGTNYPNADQQGACNSGTCHIWDWSLKASDTSLKNTTNDGSSQNAAFVGGSACPAALSPSKSLSDYTGTEVSGDSIGDDDGICEFGEACLNSKQWLINATEIEADNIGNDDGFCESNEACIYTPNFGAYQGHGSVDTTSSCSFTDGNISGVSIYSFSENGN